MADYVLIKNYSNIGDLGISRKCFIAVANEAVKRVQGAEVTTGKKEILSFNVKRPIQVFFKSNGQVEFDISIDVKGGNNVTKICTSIQEEVSNSLIAMTESVPFKINIKVASIS